MALKNGEKDQEENGVAAAGTKRAHSDQVEPVSSIQNQALKRQKIAVEEKEDLKKLVSGF